MEVLVLEASSASAKAMVYSAEKGILRTCSIPYDSSYSDGVTQDAERVFDAVIAAGKELAASFEIAAVAVCGTWHSLLICGRDLRPKTRAYSWAYRDASAKAAEIRQNRELTQELYARTGCMPNITYPSYRFMYLREQHIVPEKGDLLFGQGTYLFARLTGEILESRSMASASGFLNIHTLSWDEKVLSLCGLTAAHMPPLCGHTDTRPLSAGAAARLGVRCGIPVVPAHPDGALNQIGAGALRPSAMTLSVGTSGAMRLITPAPLLPPKAETWCYYAPGQWLVGAAVQNCTNCLDWYVQKVLQNHFSYQELESPLTGTATVPPLFLPFLFGERCPGWEDSRTASFSGLTGNDDVYSLYHGILEGVSYSLYQCYRILEKLCGTPKTVSLSGGIVKSRLWTQMLCDLFERPLTLQKNEQASLLGGACLALLASGALHSFDAFDPGAGREVRPNPHRAPYYQTRYGAYANEYEQTRKS